MEKKLKVGVVGVGNIAQSHIAAYLADPHAELYALCDINEERLKKNGEKYGITRLYTDVEEMVKLEELDAVSICTWNCAHAPCAIAALNAGKHVLCEKPMALNAAQAEEMKAAAERAGKLLMIGFVRRYGNDMHILKEFIDSDALGDVYYAKATYLRRNGNPGGWFCDKARSGGGPLIDLGVHVIDFVRYAMGNPKPISVYAVTAEKLGNRANLKTEPPYLASDHVKGEKCDVEDLACAMIRFDNGAVLNVETSFSLNIEKPEGKIELFGDKGGACINPELKLFSEQNGYMTNVTLEAETALSFENLFHNEVSHFVDCALFGKTCKSPAEDGVQLMRILESAYASAASGHEVIIEQE